VHAPCRPSAPRDRRIAPQSPSPRSLAVALAFVPPLVNNPHFSFPPTGNLAPNNLTLRVSPSLQRRARAPTAASEAPVRRSTRERTEINYAERFGDGGDDGSLLARPKRRSSEAGPLTLPQNTFTMCLMPPAS
jgi:hypothetical protein